MALTNTSIQLSDAARAGVEQAHRRTGMPKVGLWERLGEWFGRQDPKLQNLILGVEPADTEMVVIRLIVQQMLGRGREQAEQLAEQIVQDAVREADAKQSKKPGRGSKKRRPA